jgi:F-type H+-transporting ATPase subunit b
MFLELDGTFWIQLVNFAIFFAILNVVFLRPVGRAIKERREYIEGVKAECDRATREAGELRTASEERRAAARREALERIGTQRAKAQNEAEAIAQDYGSKASGIAADARATVEREVADARMRENELATGLGDALLQRALEALSR